MNFVLDASVHLNALNSAEAGSAESQALIERLFRKPWPVISPTLLLVEVAAAVARVFNDAGRGMAIAQALRGLPGQIWVPLDEEIAVEAAPLAGGRRLPGAGGFCGGVPRRYGAVLVTLDRQQRERLSDVLPVLTSAEALARLETGEEGG